MLYQTKYEYCSGRNGSTSIHEMVRMYSHLIRLGKVDEERDRFGLGGYTRYRKLLREQARKPKERSMQFD